MSDALHEYTDIIFPEMMSHPALFIHPNPKKIAIFGDTDNRILLEVLKHHSLVEIQHEHPTISDPRIISSTKKNQKDTFDVIINAANADNKMLAHFFKQLNTDGILIQASVSPFQIAQLKIAASQLQTIGFSDLQFLNFPQPDFASGWRTIILALKQGIFKRLREKVVFNKSFKTQYYNFDIHKAASALPEFMRHNDIF